MDKRKEMLAEFEQELIDECREGVKEEYLYLFSTLDRCVGSYLYHDIEELRKLLDIGDQARLEVYAKERSEDARRLTADRWDEDWGRYRSGEQYDSDQQWVLRNIALGKYDDNPYRASNLPD